jgi:hypothetical protein
MPIDPSIVLSLQPQKPVDYFGAYGNALTLKNLIGQGQMQEMQLAQAQREQQKQMRLADLVRTAGGDMGKFISGYAEIDPLGSYELGMKQRRADAELAKFGAEGRKLALESADKFKPLYLQAAQFVQANGYTPESVQQAKGFLSKSGVPADMLAAIPDNPGQQYIDSYIASNMSFGDQLARNKEDFERRYPGELGKLIAAQEQWRLSQKQAEESENTIGDSVGGSTPDQVRAPAVILRNVPSPYDSSIARLRFGDENKPFGRTERGLVVENPKVQEYEKEKAERGATRVNQFNNTRDNFENERKLRNDFKSEPIYKAHSEVRSAYGQISKALALKSPAGDLAAATKIMKLLDPGSVVRESELAMAVQASGLEDRLTNLVQNIVNGTKLTPKQREDFRKLADELNIVSEQEYDRVRGEYMETAKDYGLDSKRVGGRGPRASEKPKIEEKPKAMGSKESPFKIRGDDGFDALPKGAYFIGPDGKLRQKP